MELVFGDDRLDFGQFAHLMPQRFKIGAMIVAAKVLAAATTGIRFEHHNLVALFDRNQGPLVPRMARLTAAASRRFRLGGGRLGVWMRCRGRQRRVLRRLPEPLLKLRHSPREHGDLLRKRRHLRQQRANDRLRFRRLPSNDFLRDLKPQRHAPNVA